MSIQPSGFRPGVAEARAALRDHWATEGLMSPLGLAQAIREGLPTNPGRLVLETEAGLSETTAQELHAQALALAGALRRLGVERGDVVAMQLPNWAETMALTLAIIYAGAVVLPVVPIYGAKELAFILGQSRAKALFVPQAWGRTDYLELLPRLGPLPHLKTTVVIGEQGRPGDLLWRDVVAMGDPAFQPVDADPREICQLIYTSGTTSDPKGVLHTHQTIQAFMSREGAAADRPRNTLMFPQTGHIGHIIQLMAVVLNGDLVASMERWAPDVAARLISRYQIAGMSGAPVFLYSMLDAARTLGLDVSCLREDRLGSTAIMPADIEGWSRQGITGFRCYGSTEHPLATGKWPHASARIRAYTDGFPTPGTQVRIVDDQGVAMAVGQPGEVALLGPPQFVGYFDPQLNGEHFLEGGWFLTGDIGVLDAEGALTITDRKKDIIIRGGENISAKEVEDALAKLSWVVEAAVVAMPDERLGEKVCAFVIARDPPAEPLAAVAAHITGLGLARQKIPERLELVEDFPRTPTGKIKKFELRARMKAEHPALQS
ncbi:MAG: hypothetical protein JWQ97_2185 [Phenylobacterium sp.]|nr:hypothetical protein [Phenylobacterium sp.]